MNCRVCDHLTEFVIDFGTMPIANGFLSSVNEHEEYFCSSTVCKILKRLCKAGLVEKVASGYYQYGGY